MSYTINVLLPICVVIIIYLKTRRLSISYEKPNRQPLEVLYSPASSEPEVDIVAVHGLGSNVDWSWVWQDKTGQRPRVHWLKDLDMLPAIVPNARILAYNYESRWHANAPQTRLKTCCESLVQSLDNFYRQDNFNRKESQRPILFIGHSLGGLIILYGLSYAHRHTQYNYLPENTIGFISLGTPFRGTDMQPIARLAAWIMAPFGSHWGILEDLSYDNATLRDEIQEFGVLVKNLNISTYCFFEQFKTDYGKRFGVPGIIKGMVSRYTRPFKSEYSRKVGRQRGISLCSSMAKGILQTDHLKMNKFASPEDRGFLVVSAEISKMCKIEEPLFKQAINYLRDKCYSESKLKITRLSGAILSIDQCYINLAIVENVSINKASKDTFENFSPFSFLARQKVETPNEELQVSLADIFKSRGEFDVPGNPPRRILIRGRAGVGKTTLCKKIVHDFNQYRIWEGLFDCILWVPLRNLKGRKGSGYNFEKLLFDEFFAHSGNELGQRFSREMDTARTHKSVLFVLDGWDEVAQLAEADHDMFVFLEELLGLPNIIITSRPSASLPPGVNVHLELETIGFYPKQVDEYIMNSHTQYPDEIKSFLQSHQLVQSLARIPIQLDALCHCWKDIMADCRDVKQQTMTSLYQAIETSLWKKDIPRLKLKRVDGELIQASDIRSADQPRIENLVQRQLHFLEHLAFDGLINNIIEFEPKHLNPINNDRDHALLLDSLLPHISFLRTSNPSAHLGQNYHFIHLTFQEYFAARYFVRHWNRDSYLKSLMFKPRKDFRPAEFLARYKYDQRFNVMWRFAAGLLDVVDDKEEHHPAACFLKAIEAEPRDFLGPAHQRLVMHCLSEVVSSGWPGFSAYRKHLEEMLAQWLCIECEVNGNSLLAAEPEFPAKALEKGLKQGSEKTRKAIINAFVQRRESHATLNATFSCLDDKSLSKGMKRHILEYLQITKTPLTENHIQSVVAQLDEDENDLRASAWSILLSQPIFSGEITKLIATKFKKEYIGLRLAALDLLAKKSALTEEVSQLAAAQLEDFVLPQHMRQLVAARAQSRSSNLIEVGSSLKSEKPLTIRDLRLRGIALRILREHSAFPSEKLSWLEEQLRVCKESDRMLQCDEDLTYHDRQLALQLNGELLDEVLQILQKFDLSKETLLLVAEQLNADDIRKKRQILQIFRNQSDLSKEVLLLVVEQLKCDNGKVISDTLQVLRDQSDLSKEVLHAVAEVLILQPRLGDLQEQVTGLFTKQPVLPEEILYLTKAWQEDREQSRQIEALCIPEGQSSLSKDTLLLVVSKLRNNGARTRQAAMNCLSGQLALPEDVLYLIAEQLKNTDPEINQAAATVLKCQAVLSDKVLQLVAEQLTHINPMIHGQAAEVLKCQAILPGEILQSIVKHLTHKSYTIRTAIADVFSSRINLSQELLELIVNQLMDQTPEIQGSGLVIFVDREIPALSKQIIQLIEAQLENGVKRTITLKSILKILASQSALSTKTLQLVARQPKTLLQRHNRAAVAQFLKHQPILPMEVLELLGEFFTDDVYALKGQEEAAEVLKGQSCLPETVLRLVEKPLCTKKRINPRTWYRALEILKAQSVLSEKRLQLIATSLGKQDLSWKQQQYFRRRVVGALFGQPYLYSGVLETYLFSFYETLLGMSFSEHLVWTSQDSQSFLVKDSRHVTWNNLVSSKRESELVQEVQKSLYAEWEMPDKTFPWTTLWYSFLVYLRADLL